MGQSDLDRPLLREEITAEGGSYFLDAGAPVHRSAFLAFTSSSIFPSPTPLFRRIRRFRPCQTIGGEASPSHHLPFYSSSGSGGGERGHRRGRRDSSAAGCPMRRRLQGYMRNSSITLSPTNGEKQIVDASNSSLQTFCFNILHEEFIRLKIQCSFSSYKCARKEGGANGKEGG